ncbi:MAG: SBBP repeat-containing protein, partial [Bacteroidota bacterium]
MGKRSTDNNGVYGLAVCIDSDNNVISGGRYNCASTSTTDAIEFDTEMITGFQTSAFLYKGFIAKYNNTGTIQWLRRIGDDSGHDRIKSVNTDKDNNIYVTGYFSSTTRFGCPNTGSCNSGTSLTSQYGDDGFLAKYDPDGNFLWVEHITSDGSLNAEKARFSTSSNAVYVSGQFSGQATFGEGGSQVILNSTGTGNDVFIAKYDLNGNLLWVEQGETTDWAYATSMEVDKSDNVYIGGQFKEQITFETTTLTGAGYTDPVNPYVIKYNGSGNLQWANSYTSTSNVDVDGLAVDDDQNVYFAGAFNDELTIGTNNLTSVYSNNVTYMAKLDPSGNVLWSKKTGTRPDSNGWSSCKSITVNQNNEIYAFGMFEEDCDFDGITVTGYGNASYNVWFSKWDTDGNLGCIDKAAGGHSDYAKEIVADNNDYAYISGDSFRTGTYDCDWGSHTLYPNRTSTVTAKIYMGPSTPPSSASATPSAVCPNTATDIELSASGGTMGPGTDIYWYTGSCGGTFVGTSSPLTVSESLSSATTYYARYEGACGVTDCASTTVNVNTESDAPTGITGTTTICEGDDTDLSVDGGNLGT